MRLLSKRLFFLQEKAFVGIKYAMKKIFAAVFCLMLCLCLVFMPAFNVKSVEIEGEGGVKKVIKVYHADCVDGGKNSRGSFLKDLAKKYNKLQSDVCVIVEVYEKSELLSAVENSPPDVVSFGSGLEGILPLLSPYGGKVNFSDEFISAVSVGGEIYAAPWSYNGYFLVGGKNGVKKSGTSPFAAAYFSDKEIVFSGERTSSEDAFQSYLSSKTSFVCSAKEVTNLLSKVERGVIEMPEITPLSGYTDMVNVLGVCKKSENYAESEKFIEYVTSSSGEHLTRLNLFSPCIKVKYSVSPFSEYGKGKLVVKNVFDCENIDELAEKALGGDGNAKNALKERLK